MVEGLNRGDDEEISLAQPGRSSILRSPRRGRSDKGTMATYAEEALHNAQMELAHLTRVATLGEMTASIAHEINQPLTSVVANGSAGLRWLAAQSSNLERRALPPTYC